MTLFHDNMDALRAASNLGNGRLSAGRRSADRQKLHGDAIRVYSESEALNRGSLFVVRLPCADDVHPDSMAGEEDCTAETSRRVLVVDDNADAADSTADLLRIFGYDVAVARSGSEALETISIQQFDTVLLDIGMPTMDGFETARRIRQGESGTRLRLIAVTGWGGSEDEARTREAGFDEHWVKSIDIERLRCL